MQKPITPFFSTDKRVAPEPTPQPAAPEYCKCDAELTPQELATGKCDTCGGRVSCWNSIVSKGDNT